jgi:methyl halide transferase
MNDNTMLPDEDYWNNRYKEGDTGWDMHQVSPPLKEYIDQLTDKAIRILIPGCGSSYEAAYLAEKGFTNIILIDIAPLLVHQLKEKFSGNPEIDVIKANFFEHSGQYDLILEQTFFCAINYELRPAYVKKMYELLAVNGKLAGLLFNKEFLQNGPPFGGTATEYKRLFENNFNTDIMEPCYNSHTKRAGNEFFIKFTRK